MQELVWNILEFAATFCPARVVCVAVLTLWNADFGTGAAKLVPAEKTERKASRPWAMQQCSERWRWRERLSLRIFVKTESCF